MGWYKAFPPHLAPWNKAKRFLEGLAEQLLFTDMRGFQSLNANDIRFVVHTLGKPKGGNNAPLSAHPHWDSEHSLFRFTGYLSNL